MYLRPCYGMKHGKRHAYGALVESYRTARGPRKRVVSWLGAMDERGRLAVRRCAQRDFAVQSELFIENAPNPLVEAHIVPERSRVSVEMMIGVLLLVWLEAFFS
jgi:hypothetical protein